MSPDAHAIRPIRPSDKEALQRFHARLSSDARYRRYHGLKGDLTPADLRFLTETDEDMPREHRALLREHRVTLAVVHADGEAAKRETLHRWAHVMATQTPGSVRRYSPRRRG